jgi:excisionase family DNA binding protein
VENGNGKRIAYRIAEAADLIGVSRAKAYEMAAKGELPIVEIGGIKRVPADALAAKFKVTQKDA